MADAALPDGRAWEMVSPLDKNGGDIRGIEGDAGGGVIEGSLNGESITYVSLASFGAPQGAPIGSQYVAERDAGRGWLTQNVSLPMGAQIYGLAGQGAPYDAFSPDLSSGLVFGGLHASNMHPVESPPLVEDAPAGYENYYLRGIPGGALQALLTRAPGVPPGPFELNFLGATPDLKHVVVASPAALAPGATEAGEASNLYEWEQATGLFQTVNILPDGISEPENGYALGAGGHAARAEHAISDNGSRVVWTGPPPPSLGGSGLYIRKDIGTDHPETVQVDASQGGAPGSGHGGLFLTASNDGSKVFFADHNRLTSDSTASGGLGDLYKFESGSPEGERLTDLTVDGADSGGAEVQGVVGTSEDGSYVYFVANGVLVHSSAPGAANPTDGNCSIPESPPGATCNLYLWHEGEPIKFIATLSGEDENGFNSNVLGRAFDWTSTTALRTSRVSRDGTRLVFMSRQRLTGYDNTVSEGSRCAQSETTQCEEVFLYEASTGRVSCVSCNPSGARPTGPSGIPGGTPFAEGRATYQSRVLSEDVSGSRVFFDSADSLVPQDTNGQEDVYEYENGHVYLLSSGNGAAGATFVDASVNGDDVFFITRAQLVTQDTDQLVDLYDARAPHIAGEDVGFPAPVQVVPCESEGCRSNLLASPTLATFSSATFTGADNPAPGESKPTKKPKTKKTKKKAKSTKSHEAKRGRKARAGRTGVTVKGSR